MKPCAQYIGRYKGRRVHRYPVRVTFNNSRGRLADWLSPPRAEFAVIACTPADAADWARRWCGARAETEIDVYGPKGGRTRRYIGYESAVWAAMCARDTAAPVQPDLFTGED